MHFEERFHTFALFINIRASSFKTIKEYIFCLLLIKKLASACIWSGGLLAQAKGLRHKDNEIDNMAFCQSERVTRREKMVKF